MKRTIEVILWAIILLFVAVLSLKGIEALGEKTLDHFFDFLRILISWPLAAMLFVGYFSKDIGEFLKKVGKVTLPGGTVLEEQILETSLRTQEKFEKEDAGESSAVGEIEIYTATPEESAENFDSREIEINELKKSLEFEKVYNTIFGSQISLLSHLMAKGPAGEEKKFMEFYFEEIKKQWPALAEKTLDEYLGFLLSQELITLEYPIYKITEKGLEFLSYLKSQDYSFSKIL